MADLWIQPDDYTDSDYHYRSDCVDSDRVVAAPSDIGIGVDISHIWADYQRLCGSTSLYPANGVSQDELNAILSQPLVIFGVFSCHQRNRSSD